MLHAPQLPVAHAAVAVLHVTVLVCVPFLLHPQVWLSAGFVVSTQLPQLPSLPHFFIPHVPQLCVCPALHSHSPTLHAPHVPSFQVAFVLVLLQVGVLVCVPLLLHPHAWLVSGFFVSLQFPNAGSVHFPVKLLQLTVLVCIPHVPHAWLSGGFVPLQFLVHFEVSQFPQLPPPQLAVQFLVAVPPV
jgi:hypothetical protein